MAGRNDETQDLPYEKVMERLEAIVQQLEQGELSLEDQIARFAEGTRLVDRAQKLLDDAEGKVEQLLGGDRTEAFGVEGGRGPGAGTEDDDIAF